MSGEPAWREGSGPGSPGSLAGSGVAGMRMAGACRRLRGIFSAGDLREKPGKYCKIIFSQRLIYGSGKNIISITSGNRNNMTGPVR